MVISFDSSAWMHYFMNGLLCQYYADKLPTNPKSVITPTLVLYEICRNLKRNNMDDRFQSMCLSELERTHVVDLTKDLAYYAVDVAFKHKMATADSIIYTTAQVFGAKLFTCDADFKSLPGVEYIAPEEK